MKFILQRVMKESTKQSENNDQKCRIQVRLTQDSNRFFIHLSLRYFIKKREIKATLAMNVGLYVGNHDKA